MPEDRQIVSELRNYYTENDDIEPLSRNKFLFTYGLKSGNYGQKESGQTDFSTNLSAFAPLMFEILNLWAGFREVVKFIENNRTWLDVVMGNHYLYRTNR